MLDPTGTRGLTAGMFGTTGIRSVVNNNIDNNSNRNGTWVTYLAVDAWGREGFRVLRYSVQTDVRHIKVERLGLILAAEPYYSSADADSEGGGVLGGSISL